MRPIIAITTLCSLALGACSSPETAAADYQAKAQAATAEAVPGLAAASIEIANLKRLAAKATWDAKTSQGSFACTSDEHFSLPDCQPSGG